MLLGLVVAAVDSGDVCPAPPGSDDQSVRFSILDVRFSSCASHGKQHRSLQSNMCSIRSGQQLLDAPKSAHLDGESNAVAAVLDGTRHLRATELRRSLPASQ